MKPSKIIISAYYSGRSRSCCINRRNLVAMNEKRRSSQKIAESSIKYYLIKTCPYLSEHFAGSVTEIFLLVDMKFKDNGKGGQVDMITIESFCAI